MNKISLLILATFISLCNFGCSEKRTEYVIYRDIPENPTITVVPLLRWDIKDKRLCITLERHLIGLGIAVMNAPPEHEETVTTGGGNASVDSTDTGAKAKAKGDSVEKRYSSVQDIHSTFVAIVDGSTEKMRVLRMDGQQVVAVIDYANSDGNAFMRAVTDRASARAKSLHDLMESLGFKLKQ